MLYNFSNRATPVRLPDPRTNPIARVLEQSVQVRLRSIEEKLSLASTFCVTAEIEIKYGNINRARYLLQKTQSFNDALAAHINHSQIPSRYRTVFRQGVARIAERVELLVSQLNKRRAENL